MSRLVLDTNCLIQIISPKSRYHILWETFISGKNTLCVSNEIIEEYVEIMQRLIGYRAAEYIVKTISTAVLLYSLILITNSTLLRQILMTTSLSIVLLQPKPSALLQMTTTMIYYKIFLFQKLRS